MAGKVEVIKKGKVVASSRNLEVLGRYHRITPVIKSTIKQTANGSGILKVTYRDGAKATAKFDSFGVLKNWIETKRKRSGWR